MLARRQIRVPKQNLPAVLIALTAVSLIALAVVQVLLWANPFEGGPELYVARDGPSGSEPNSHVSSHTSSTTLHQAPVKSTNGQSNPRVRGRKS